MTHQPPSHPHHPYQHHPPQSPPPSSPPFVHYQHQPASKRGDGVGNGGEQFEIIDDSTTADANENEVIKRQLSTASSTHQNHPANRTDRLIVGEMSTGNLVHNEARAAAQIFGPFHRLSRPFFSAEMPSARRRSPKTMLFFLLLLLLVGRAIYYFTQLGKSMNLSLDWARASLQVSLTLNAVGVLGWMHQNGGFPRQFASSLLTAIGHNPPRCSTRSMVLACVTAIFFVYTSVVWALLRMMQLQFVDTVVAATPAAMMATNNGTPVTNPLQQLSPLLANNGQNGTSGIESLYRISLTCLDALLAILSGFLSALGLGIFLLSFACVLSEWETYKKEQIDQNSDNARLTHPDVFSAISDYGCRLLRFAHFTGNKFEQLGTGMFMTAIFCNIAASFIAGVTGANENGNGGGGGAGQPQLSPVYSVLDKVNNVNWSILSIILLVITIKGPYDVHSKIREIKEQLLLDDRLWNGNSEQDSSPLVKNFISRIGGIRIHRIGSQLFQLVFIAQMVLVWLLISGSNSSSRKK